MLIYVVGAGVLAWVFRRALGRWLAQRLPDRTTRHRVLGAIVIAFVITIAVRLLARYFG